MVVGGREVSKNVIAQSLKTTRLSCLCGGQVKFLLRDLSPKVVISRAQRIYTDGFKTVVLWFPYLAWGNGW